MRRKKRGFVPWEATSLEDRAVFFLRELSPAFHCPGVYGVLEYVGFFG